MPLKEIRKRFELCEAEPNMRSISAILRITREQLESRGQLGIYPVLSGIAFAILVVAGSASLFFPPSFREILEKVAMASASIFLLLMFGVFKVRHTRRSNLFQEQQIREAAVKSLNVILEHNPSLKPLLREQRDTVRELVRKVRPSGWVGRLLQE